MIETFFKPANIAVIGASRDPHKLGYGVVRNLLKYKFKGNIYPVHKFASEILGVQCYKSIGNLPKPADLAVIVVPAATVPSVLKECGEAGVKYTVIVSGGFGETGEEGVKLEQQVKKIADKHGIRIIGPNCIGTIDTHTPVNTTFVVGMPEQGDIGFISQSGAMVAAVIDWACGAGVGFSRIASLGNQIDVTETEMIDVIGEDPQTGVVTAYIEGISDGRMFLKRAERIAREKPLIVLKGGQSSKGAEAVSSHTGALAGSKEVHSAAFRKCGALEAHTMEEMFDWARALAWQPLPEGRRVAVLTNAGGPAILAVDALEKFGLELSELSDETKNYLKKRLPKAASCSNPVDVLAGSGPATYTLALESLLTDENVDAVIVIQAPQDWFLPASLAEVVGEAAGLHNKPVIASIMGKASVDEALAILHKRKVPNVSFPERSASVLSAMVQRKEWLEMIKNREKIKIDFKKENIGSHLENKEWFQILEKYGIPAVPQKRVSSLKQAVDASAKIGYPVVMKVVSEKHTHKSDIGGVKINLAAEEDVLKAWNEISETAERMGFEFEGVLIQKMLKNGQEVIIGIKQDPQFGPAVLFGSGGTDVELYNDIETAIAPLCQLEAERLVDSTIAGKKLQGWRNLLPGDRKAVIDILLKMSFIAHYHPEISEMEINPLYVMENGSGAYAVDVRGNLEK